MSKPDDSPGVTSQLAAFAALSVAGGLLAAVVSVAAEPLSRDAVPGMSFLGWAAFFGLHVIISTLLVVPVAVGTALSAARDSFRWAAELLSGLAFGLFCFFVGVDAVSGPWASTQSWAYHAPAVTAVAGFVGAFVAVGLVRRRLSAWMLAPGLIAMTTLLVADVKLFPGTYPVLHLGLRVAAVGAAIATIAASTRVIPVHPGRRSAAIAGLIMALAPVAWFGQPDSATKSMLLRRGPAAYLADELTVVATDDSVDTRVIDLPSVDRSPPLHHPTRPQPAVDNVVLFYVDTLRHDAIPPNRPAEGTRFAKTEDTPFLNDYLASCHRFERAFAPSSATHKSIPSTFGSRQAWQFDEYPLGLILAERGVTPAATVLNYFDHTVHDSATRLLTGFENVRIYDSMSQSDVVPRARSMLDDVAGDRFFAWVHFFAVHRPGWDGELLPMSMPQEVRYRRSLAWLDKTLGLLVRDLEARGVADRTAIIIASDHGEGIGDHDVPTHGPTVFDSEIQVPLAICLPGDSGSIRGETVGNIDLIPTLLDLMGLERDPTHLGHSFAGLLLDDEPWPERSYYFENWSGDRSGVWYEDKKLMFAPHQSLYFMYDHASDPTESQDVFDPDEHHAYVRLLKEKNPNYLREAAKDDAFRVAIVERLDQTDPVDPPADIEALLRFGAIVGGEPVESVVTRIFMETPHEQLRYRIFDAYRLHGFVGGLLAEYHAQHGASPRLIEAAARHRIRLSTFPPVEGFVIGEWPRASADHRAAWLQLANHAQKEGPEWTAWLTKQLAEAGKRPESLSGKYRMFLVANVLTTNWPNPDQVGQLLQRSVLADPDPNVQRTAIRALSYLGHKQAYLYLLGIVADENRDYLVRREAIRAIGTIGEAKNGPQLMRTVQDDMFLSRHATFALAQLGDTESAKKLIERHPRIADDAREALRKASEK